MKLRKSHVKKSSSLFLRNLSAFNILPCFLCIVFLVNYLNGRRDPPYVERLKSLDRRMQTAEAVIGKVIINNTIIVTGMNYGYREMFMNWVCNLRSLNITNFALLAFDVEIYHFALSQHVAVVYEDLQLLPTDKKQLLDQALYGTSEFKKLTRLKTRAVVSLLHKGFNVLWSDCDVIFFRNPLLDLWAYQGDIVIQSNAPDFDKLNGKHRINSGFYLARSNLQTIKAFHDIINYCKTTKFTEQPCFYHVLCGIKCQKRVGDNMCVHNDVTVKFADRRRYPNGATNDIWNTTGKILDIWPRLFILHNNWAVGQEKHNRLQRHGFIFYDRHTDQCKPR